MKIGELIVRLGVQADTFKVKDFTSAIGEVPVLAATAVAAIGAMGMEFMDLTKNTIDLSNNLSMFRAETGLSTDELQRWQVVAKQVGMSGDVVTQSILGITNALAQIRLGHGESMLPFGRLGVDFRGKDAFQILKDIGKSDLLRREPNTARALMSQIGVSPEMMKIFGLGPQAFERMAKEGPELGNQDIQAMQDFQRELARFNIIVERSFVPALTAVEPYMGDLAEVLGDLVAIVGKGAGGALGLLHGIRSKDPRMDEWIATPGNQSFEAYKRSHPVHIETNVTQNIHSTGDPEAVADVAKEHFTREKVKAAKSLDNAGY